MPERVQRKRTKGWRMPPNTVSITRPGKYGNPFRIGGWFMVGPGAGRPGMIWCEARDEKVADGRFTKVETAEEAVILFKVFSARYPLKYLDQLRGKNLACFCRLDQPCHGDVLLELANAAPRLSSSNGERG
jgi:hypothetical protein